jgi:hypothetical protein
MSNTLERSGTSAAYTSLIKANQDYEKNANLANTNNQCLRLNAEGSDEFGKNVNAPKGKKEAKNKTAYFLLPKSSSSEPQQVQQPRHKSAQLSALPKLNGSWRANVFSKEFEHRLEKAIRGGFNITEYGDVPTFAQEVLELYQPGDTPSSFLVKYREKVSSSGLLRSDLFGHVEKRKGKSDNDAAYEVISRAALIKARERIVNDIPYKLPTPDSKRLWSINNLRQTYVEKIRHVEASILITEALASTSAHAIHASHLPTIHEVAEKEESDNFSLYQAGKANHEVGRQHPFSEDNEILALNGTIAEALPHSLSFQVRGRLDNVLSKQFIERYEALTADEQKQSVKLAKIVLECSNGANDYQKFLSNYREKFQNDANNSSSIGAFYPPKILNLFGHLNSTLSKFESDAAYEVYTRALLVFTMVAHQKIAETAGERGLNIRQRLVNYLAQIKHPNLSVVRERAVKQIKLYINIVAQKAKKLENDTPLDLTNAQQQPSEDAAQAHNPLALTREFTFGHKQPQSNSESHSLIPKKTSTNGVNNGAGPLAINEQKTASFGIKDKAPAPLQVNSNSVTQPENVLNLQGIQPNNGNDTVNEHKTAEKKRKDGVERLRKAEIGELRLLPKGSSSIGNDVGVLPAADPNTQNRNYSKVGDEKHLQLLAEQYPHLLEQILAYIRGRNFNYHKDQQPLTVAS